MLDDTQKYRVSYSLMTTGVSLLSLTNMED